MIKSLMMRTDIRLVVCFVISMASVMYTNAQVQFGARAGLGFPAIINQNNYGQSELDYLVSVKPTGSIFVGFNLENDNEIQLRLAYRALGQKYNGVAQETTYDREIKMTSLEISIPYRFDLASPFVVDQKLYFLVGPRIGYVLSAEQDFFINGQATDFTTYALDRVNPNESEILRLGEPEDHKDFFASYDLGLFGGMGYESSINDQLYWNVELIGSIGITDINAFDWKLPNREEKIYESSYNILGGINIGITYYLDIRTVPRN